MCSPPFFFLSYKRYWHGERPASQAEVHVAAPQQPVAVLVATVLLQDAVASPYAFLTLPSFVVVNGESAEHVYVSVDEALALDHGPILVEVLHQVLAPVQFDGFLVLGARLPPPVFFVQAAALLVAGVELGHVGDHLH